MQQRVHRLLVFFQEIDRLGSIKIAVFVIKMWRIAVEYVIWFKHTDENPMEVEHRSRVNERILHHPKNEI